MSSKRLINLIMCVTLATGAAGGCGERNEGSDGGDRPVETEVIVGLGGPRASDFTPLASGDTIPLETFGQGGNHAALVVQCRGFGDAVFVRITLRNLEGEVEVSTPPFAQPQPLACEDRGFCRTVEIFVMTGGLADPESLDGLHIAVEAVVDNGEVIDRAEIDGYLRRL